MGSERGSLVSVIVLSALGRAAGDQVVRGRPNHNMLANNSPNCAKVLVDAASYVPI